MKGITEKTLVGSSKAHAVLKWTIEDAASLQNKTGKTFNSEPLLFTDYGFGTTSYKWNLEVTSHSAKKAGDPQYLGVYLRLKGEKNEEEKVRVIFHVHLSSGETLHQPIDKEYNGPSQSWGYPEGISHAQLFGNSSRYLSKDGALTLRATIDFEIANTPAPYHFAGLCRRQAQLYNSKDSTDFVLISSDNKEFPVHRVILATHSPVFEAMFEHGDVEKKSNRVVLDDVDGDALDILLKYIYCGDILEVREMARKVMEAADKYQVLDLRNLAIKYLCESVAVENAYSLLVVADSRHLTPLGKAASEFTVNNWNAVQDTTKLVEFKKRDGPMYTVLETFDRAKRRRVEPS